MATGAKFRRTATIAAVVLATAASMPAGATPLMVGPLATTAAPAGPPVIQVKNRVTTGDVIAGAALAGIIGLTVGAAIASNNNSNRVYVEPGPGPYRGGPGIAPDVYDGPGINQGIKRTYNQCTKRAERYFAKQTGSPAFIRNVSQVQYLGGDMYELRGAVKIQYPRGTEVRWFDCRTVGGDVVRFDG